MKFLAVVLVSFAAFAQDPPKEVKKAVPPPGAAAAPAAPVDPEKEKEQQELNKSIGEAGNSPIDFMRALENHLKKYPNSAQKANIEKAIAKAAVEIGDNKRIIEYGQRALATGALDLQLMDRLLKAMLTSDDKETAILAMGYANRYQLEIEKLGKQPPPGNYSEAQWKEEIDKGLARALVYKARASGNQDRLQDAVDFAKQSWEAYPTAVGARETGRWLAKLGRNLEAVEALANAFTVEDPLATEAERGKDRIRMGELYQKATGSEKGLGDLILQAYDRTHAMMTDRMAKLKAADPNVQASKITDFTLVSLDGEKLPISSLHGKTVIMDFWATWCGPCRAQHPLYEQVHERFKTNPNVVFLAVATDEDHDVVAPTLKERKWDSKSVYFESGLTKLLDISSIPTTIIVDKNGNIASRMNGFTPERFVDLLTDRIINELMKN